LFERGVSARKFQSTKVDVFEDEGSEEGSMFEGTGIGMKMGKDGAGDRGYGEKGL